MTSVAVIAHERKQLDGGLDELRRLLAREGVTHPGWHEVDKSRKAPKQVRRALADGADLLLVWGGDGMVQRCLDAAAGRDVTVGILPAGTANLLASNLGIPRSLPAAVDIALHGERRAIDLGVVNGEHFAVMAGTGFDASMIRDADRGLKERLGRLAYIRAGARNLNASRVRTRIDVDGRRWHDGPASCVLFGNVGTVFGGVEVFAEARPDDGVLDVGVVTARGRWQWFRTLARTVLGRATASPFVRSTTGTRFVVKLDERRPFELDGGDRDAAKKLIVDVVPRAVRVCVPVAPAVPMLEEVTR